MAVFCSKNLNWVFEEAEVYAFFFCVCNFFKTSWHFCTCTAVNDVYLFCTKTECHAGSVHSNVTSTTNYYMLCFVDWSCSVFFIVTLHEVSACKIFVCTEYTDEVFTRNAHELWKTCTSSYECSVESFFFKK